MDLRENSLSPEADFIDAVVKHVRFRPDRRAIAEELRFFGVTAEDIARRYGQAGEVRTEKGEKETP